MQGSTERISTRKKKTKYIQSKIRFIRQLFTIQFHNNNTRLDTPSSHLQIMFCIHSLVGFSRQSSRSSFLFWNLKTFVSFPFQSTFAGCLLHFALLATRWSSPDTGLVQPVQIDHQFRERFHQDTGFVWCWAPAFVVFVVATGRWLDENFAQLFLRLQELGQSWNTAGLLAIHGCWLVSLGFVVGF